MTRKMVQFNIKVVLLKYNSLHESNEKNVNPKQNDRRYYWENMKG